MWKLPAMLLAVLALAGCPSFPDDLCDEDGDCPSGRCDLETGRCVAPGVTDGGTASDGGGGGDDGGTPSDGGGGGEDGGTASDGGGGVDGGTSDGGGGGEDGGTIDGGGGTDAGTPQLVPRIVPTAGGGEVTSPGFRARISIGAPGPYGTTAGSGKQATTGALPKP